MPTLPLSVLFTAEELDRAVKLFVSCRPGEFTRKARDQIVEPVINRINEKTGQSNDPMYIAYVLEYALTSSLE